MPQTISKAKLEAVREELKVLTMDAFKSYNRFGGLEPLTMMVPTTVPTVNFKWLGRISKVREWVGPRELGLFEAHDFQVTTKNWEHSIGIDRYDLEDDNLGVYRPQIESMAADGAEHSGLLLAGVLNNAFTSLCYDGQYLCDTDHPMRQSDGSVATGSNKVTGVLNETNLMTALLAPRAWRTPQGTTFNLKYDTLVVPPELETTAIGLRDYEYRKHATDAVLVQNTAYKRFQNIIVNPYLTSATAWFLVDTSKPLKPLLFQERQGWRMDMVTDPSDSHVFLTREFMFGMDARYVAAPGIWQLIYGSTGAG
jgi:phage major head subunit gpT-like protein